MASTRANYCCSTASRHPATSLPALLAVGALLLTAWPAAATAQINARPHSITVFLSGAGGFGGGTGSGAGTAEMAALSVELARHSLPWVLGLEGQHDWTLVRADTTNGGGSVSSTSEAVHLWIHHDWRSESSWTPFFGAAVGVGGLNPSDSRRKAYASFGLDGGTSYQPGPVGLRVGARAQFSQHGALVFMTLGLRVRVGPALGGWRQGGEALD